MKNLPPMNRQRVAALLYYLLAGLVAPVLYAVDWPQYRGPNHDGVSTEIIGTNWSEEPPRQIWKVPLEPGLSSLVISGGKVFTQVRRRTDGG
ncbi:MAG: hypothetical protein DME26_00110, partial [Verrucomicrobia bacterium]